jgi:hypothetical protein
MASQGTQGATGTGTQGAQGTTGTTGANAGITSYTNPGDNRVLTSVDANTINAESNLTFNGSTLSVTGAITATGDITAYFTSDARHKNNIQPIENALDKVKKINGVIWEWDQETTDEVTKTLPNTGLIAQEVKEILPEVVIERQDGYLAIDYSKMLGLIVEAIKELDKKIS